MKLILDTLERARLAAAPAEADALRVALIDLEALAAALSRNGWGFGDAASAMDALKDIREHVRAQPFEVVDDLLTQGRMRGPIIDDLTPDAFADWLATLESLAQ